jgi:hypothetical protein
MNGKELTKKRTNENDTTALSSGGTFQSITSIDEFEGLHFIQVNEGSMIWG